MLLALLLVLAGEQAQPQTKAETPPPALKHCPDGAAILASQTCPFNPDHRFEVTHEPPRRVRTQRWWCRESSRPSEASITIEQRQPAAPQGSLTYVRNLDSLVVEGRPAPEALMQDVREKMARARRLYDIGARCLDVRSGGTVPVLVLRHFADGRHQRVEIPLR